MIRFFVDLSRINGRNIEFDRSDSHHITTVLKMKPGQRVTVLDGLGMEYATELAIVSKTGATAVVTDSTVCTTESHIRITVAQALPKSLDRLEFVLQHAVEVGVSEFIVFTSDRGRDDVERLQGKLPRWTEIVKTAAEQSRRAVLPTLQGIVSYSDMLSEIARNDLSLLAYEDENERSLRQALEGRTPERILIIIGPEGGFTNEEVRLARAEKALSVSLGPRILRTETAAIVMASQIIYAFEPFQSVAEN